ncbi:MAG: hypothetical protein ACRDSK_28980 [Actinophytocola sp.]|uniref:hypothetical protein n=1 Tax=Actinophytocola sp. TaxID=1872138 RepID=UPI003D6C6766
MTREAEWGTTVLAGLAVAGCWAVPGRTVQPGTFARTSILVLLWVLAATPGVFAAKVLLARRLRPHRLVLRAGGRWRRWRSPSSRRR